MKREMKSYMLMEIKEIAADGTFEGILSPYGNVDDGADVVEPGAYTKTLKDQGNKVPMLWQHKADVPIGELTLDDRPDGLWCKGNLLMDLPEAQKAYLLIKAKIVKGLSIGFKSIKDSVQSGVRHLKEIRLYEGSVVTFPMNENALITSVKSALETKDDFNEQLAEIQLSDAGYQMRYAISNALSSLFWAGLTREQMMSLAETIIQQFSEAYMAYLPMYIDMLAEYYGDVETWSDKRLETKSGATHSAATKSAIMEACKSIKAGHDALQALIGGAAGIDSTASDDNAAKSQPEPASDHSAVPSLIDEIKAAVKPTDK